MEDELKERQIQVLSEVSQTLSRVLNLDQALEFILGVLSRAFSLKQVGITFKDPETGQLRGLTSRDLKAAGQPRAGSRPGEGLAGLILQLEAQDVFDIGGQHSDITRFKALVGQSDDMVGHPLHHARPETGRAGCITQRQMRIHRFRLQGSAGFCRRCALGKLLSHRGAKCSHGGRGRVGVLQRYNFLATNAHAASRLHICAKENTVTAGVILCH